MVNYATTYLLHITYLGTAYSIQDRNGSVSPQRSEKHATVAQGIPMTNATDKAKNAALNKEINRLITKTLRGIRQGRSRSSGDKEKYFRTAEYFLLRSRQYVSGAWEMLEKDRAYAAFALTRWVLEAALNLGWVASDKGKMGQRLNELVGEALRQDANLLDGLAELWPGQACALQQMKKKAQEFKKNLKVNGRLANLETRLKDIKLPDEDHMPKLYPLYRTCCSAAHPGLNPWEWSHQVGPARVIAPPCDDTTMLTPDRATCMLVLSVAHLLWFACLLAGIDPGYLNQWWKKKGSRLL